MNNLINPKARSSQILIQELAKELLIYDLTINKAFSLNETCAMVWRECDGVQSIDEITEKLILKTRGLINREVVWLALESLKKENLLLDDVEIPILFNGLNRREVIRKVGFASMVAIPLITSLIAPFAANAQSVVCVNPGGLSTGDTFISLGIPGTCLPNSCDFPCNNSQGFCCSNRAFEISCFTSLGMQECTCECNFPI